MFGTTSLASAFTFSCMTLMIGTRSFGDVNWEQALLESLVDFIGVVLRLRYWSEFFKEISSTTSKRNIRKLLDLLKLLENPTNLLTCPTEKLFVLLKDVPFEVLKARQTGIPNSMNSWQRNEGKTITTIRSSWCLQSLKVSSLSGFYLCLGFCFYQKNLFQLQIWRFAALISTNH